MCRTVSRRIVVSGVRASLAAMLAVAATFAGPAPTGRAEDGTPAADAPREAPADRIEPGGWHTDLTTARAQAARDGRPLFVVFRCER
jgi:hypothetical protein